MYLIPTIIFKKYSCKSTINDGGKKYSCKSTIDDIGKKYLYKSTIDDGGKKYLCKSTIDNGNLVGKEIHTYSKFTHTIELNNI